jgi:hypothetical protein
MRADREGAIAGLRREGRDEASRSIADAMEAALAAAASVGGKG